MNRATGASAMGGLSPYTAELGALVALAGPVVLGQVAFVALNLVAVGVAGRVSGDALAAVSVGNIWSFGVLIFGLGSAIGLDPLFSQAVGAGDTGAQHRALGRALLGVGALSLPLALLHLAAGPALRLLRQPEAVVPMAQAYCEALAWGVPAVMFFFILRSYLHGLGLTRPVAVAAVAANAVNAVVAVGLGLGALGLPALGPEGCGWALTLARVSMPVTLLVVCPEARAGLWAALGHLDPGPAWRTLKLVLPVGVQTATEVEAFNLVGLMMGWVSPAALAANGLMLGFSSLCFMVPLGLGVAAATRVGNRVGAGQPWGLSAGLAVGLAAAVMAVSAVLLLAVGEPLLGWWTQDPAVLEVAWLLLPMVAAFQVFDGVQAACFGVLRGAGDLRVPSLANVVGYWLVGLPLGAWLGFGLGWGVQGVWAGLVLALVLVAGLLLVRVRQIHAQGGVRVGVSDAA